MEDRCSAIVARSRHTALMRSQIVQSLSWRRSVRYRYTLRGGLPAGEKNRATALVPETEQCESGHTRSRHHSRHHPQCRGAAIRIDVGPPFNIRYPQPCSPSSPDSELTRCVGSGESRRSGAAPALGKFHVSMRAERDRRSGGWERAAVKPTLNARDRSD